MAHVNRRIGKSSETAIDTADGTGGGVLDAFLHDYFNRSGNLYNAPGIIPVTGMTATGGVISDYTSGSNVYRAHIFTSSGTFNVTALGTNNPTAESVEYLVVAGGGGGGGAQGGGGGAGGLRTNLSGHPLAGSAFPVSTSPGSYTVTVGGGGASDNTPGNSGTAGQNSVFGSITSQGGGAGGGTGGSAGPGGSGGGNADRATPNVGGTGNRETGTTNPAPTQGNDGGAGSGSPNQSGGGGGGAGSAGTDGTAPPGEGGDGGNGVQVLIAGPPASDQPIGTPGPVSGKGYFAGGGGGGTHPNVNNGGEGGYGGGGDGANSYTSPSDPSTLVATVSTGGGGGGGGGGGPTGTPGGHGGSGIVVVRYQIGTTNTAKATGGAISFYGSKTIHTFTSSGSFTNTSGSPLTVDHIIVAGGGSGGGQRGGGGGAGGVRTSIPGLMPATVDSQVTVSPGAPNAVSVQVGGGAAAASGPFPGGVRGANGTPSYFGTPLTAPGGGGGGGDSTPTAPGLAGGSGGGGAGYNGVAAGGASPHSDPDRFGYPGGTASFTGPRYGAGGGGGAGGAGSNGGGSDAGDGGVGKQLPPAFRDPQSSVGAPGPSGTYWIAGGGGGGIYNAGAPNKGLGGGPGGPYAGGGDGAPGSPGVAGGSGLENTGGGGGGGSNGDASYYNRGGHGGSGLVLIAYPT